MTSLPKSSKELREVFKNARTPEIGEFRGEFAVHMLTVLPSLHRLRHRKIFIPERMGVAGRNVLFHNSGWGNFFLEEGVVEGPEKIKAVVINYNVPENTVLTRGIRDFVRAVHDKRLYLGRLNIMIGGKPRFLGYFSLTRIESA